MDIASRFTATSLRRSPSGPEKEFVILHALLLQPLNRLSPVLLTST
jgi:hypothetical protein